MDHDRLCHLLLDGREVSGPEDVPVGEWLRAEVAADRALELVVRGHHGIAVPEAVEQVAAGMDAPSDHAARVRAVETAMSWHLPDPCAPMALLPPDTLVHAPTLFGGAVFTHRLGAVEQVDGELHIHTDLAAFQRSHCAFAGAEQLHVEDRDGAVVVWMGPYGWLDAYPLDALLAVRVSSDGERFRVTMEALAVDPSWSPAVVSLLRDTYDAETARTGLPVTAEDLALGMLLRDHTCFAVPRRPLTELASAAGLERRGHEFGHDPGVWTRAAADARRIRLTAALGRSDAAGRAVRAVTLLDRGRSGDLRDALDLLNDEIVLHAVTGELVSDIAAFVGHSRELVVAADRPVRAAVAHWFAAVAAERRGLVLEADAHLRAAVRSAPEWVPALRRLAEYGRDRGDVAVSAPDLVLRMLDLAEAHLRRSQEFGSGTWAEMADLPGCDESLAVDVLLWEEGWFARFLADRGPLLPADEARIAAGWVGVERTVFDVVGVTTLRDLRSGQRITVTDVGFPVGARLCGRAVPVGTGHRLVGEVVGVPPGRDAQLGRVLHRRDGRGLLAWVEAAAGPTDQLVEGDPKVHCEAVLRIGSDPSAALDTHYAELQPGWWAWLSDDGGVLGSVMGDGNEVTASTSSEAHMDRLLADLAVVLPSFVVVREERHPVRPWRPSAG
ncbi:MAG: hypothetical protein L0I24_06295 [Pseudonocardia sp.]|nr:hypothetical protein [Pseudonocardia sp.]